MLVPWHPHLLCFERSLSYRSSVGAIWLKKTLVVVWIRHSLLDFIGSREEIKFIFRTSGWLIDVCPCRQVYRKLSVVGFIIKCWLRRLYPVTGQLPWPYRTTIVADWLPFKGVNSIQLRLCLELHSLGCWVVEHLLSYNIKFVIGRAFILLLRICSEHAQPSWSFN
jgi:hypothetical protein